MLRFDARAPAARRPVRRSASGPVHPLLALQTTVGNAATAGLISVQRKAPELGLFQKVQHSGFAGEAAAIWRTDKVKTIKEYTEGLLAKGQRPARRKQGSEGSRRRIQQPHR